MKKIAKIADLETKGFVSFSYPEELRQAVTRAQRSWKEFCDLPDEVKLVFAYSNTSAGVGYEKKDGSGPMGDIKENFDVSFSGYDWLRAKLDAFYNPFALDFVNDALALVKIMTPFVVNFAEECEPAFGLSGFTEEIAGGSDTFFIRFLHYPPQKIEGEVIAQAHPDQSGMTPYFFVSDPGLEYLTFDGEWLPLQVSKNEIIITPDMQMQLRSKGRLRALWHRVVATTKTAQKGRYSAVSFIQFKDTPKYDKDTHGRLQEKPEGFNYKMSHKEFSKLFK